MERTDNELMAEFFLAALNRGVFMSSRGMIVLATIMDETIIDEAVERLELAMRDVSENLC